MFISSRQARGQSLNDRGFLGDLGKMVKSIFHKPKAPDPPLPPPAAPPAPAPLALPAPPVEPAREGLSEPLVPDPVPTKSLGSKVVGYAGDLGVVAAGTVAGGEFLENHKGGAKGSSGNSTDLPTNSTDPVDMTNSPNPTDYSTPGNPNNPTTYYSGNPNNPTTYYSGNPNNPTAYYSTSGSSTNPNNPTYSSSTSSTNPGQSDQYTGNPNYDAYYGLQGRAPVRGEEALSLFGRMLDELD